MDITSLFKSHVQTVRNTNEFLGAREQKQNVFSRTKKDVHLTKAKEIVKQVATLETSLLESKAAYLNVLNYLSTNKTMNEIDRQQIDEMAESIISKCTNLIGDYKKEIGALPQSRQKQEHYQNVIETLERYLKTVSKIYAQAKAVRIKRVIETHKLSKLETKPSHPQIENSGKHSKVNLEVNSVNQKEEIRNPPASPPVDYDNELSSEEMQMFKSENNVLYDELNSTSNEVKQIESKVVHIAELQDLFTEKVLQQEKDIERIGTTVVGSTENVRDANEQIRQAIQRNAGLRVWVLFFLLVMSFSLLFLDWYND